MQRNKFRSITIVTRKKKRKREIIVKIFRLSQIYINCAYLKQKKKKKKIKHGIRPIFAQTSESVTDTRIDRISALLLELFLLTVTGPRIS